MRTSTTRLALGWALGSVIVALCGVALVLVVADLLAYDGRCTGGLLPFLADSPARDCSFTEYVEGHGLFTLKVLVATVWPIALLFVILALAFGMARDRERNGTGRS